MYSDVTYYGHMRTVTLFKDIMDENHELPYINFWNQRRVLNALVNWIWQCILLHPQYKHAENAPVLRFMCVDGADRGNQ